MIPGLFGYSLIFELFVFYLSWTFVLSKLDRYWLFFILGLLILLALTSPSGGEWAGFFSGDYSILWRGLAEDFGFR
ncbi:MAG: hypothetical protein AABW68_01835 [archaeon]